MLPARVVVGDVLVADVGHAFVVGGGGDGGGGAVDSITLNHVKGQLF